MFSVFWERNTGLSLLLRLRLSSFGPRPRGNARPEQTRFFRVPNDRELSRLMSRNV